MIARARLISAAMVICLPCSLSGCISEANSGKSRGATIADASSYTDSIDGINLNYLDASLYYEGVKPRSSILLSIDIERGYFVAEPTTLINFLLRMSWSINTRPTNDYIDVTINALGDPDHNWQEDASQLEVDLDPSGSSQSITITADAAASAFGPWPDNPQRLPKGTVRKK